MTPLEALQELLARLGSSEGAVLVSEEELGRWPAAAVSAMKNQKLLVKASPATSAVCPGCEQECTMPVHTLTHARHDTSSFIVCDKRDDINRVGVPSERLKQWRAAAASIADLIADLLDLRHSGVGSSPAGRWEVGMFKERKRSSHIVLVTDGGLAVSLAGHSIALADILTFENESFKLDRRTMNSLVANPIAGARDAESAAQRRARLKGRVQAEKNKGNKKLLKTVAEDEGISVSRLKQLSKD